MAKRNRVLNIKIDPTEAMNVVASFNRTQRRDKRLEIGRISTLSGLNQELANFFFGECMVFSQISEDINRWITENYVEKGGTPTNYMRLRDLYEFYQALTSDVDIRYDLVKLDSGDYDIKDPSIVGNDFYIPKQFD